MIRANFALRVTKVIQLCVESSGRHNEHDRRGQLRMANILHRGAPGWSVVWQMWAKTYENWWHTLWHRASDPQDVPSPSPSLLDTRGESLARPIGTEMEFALFFQEFKQPLYGYVRRIVANDEIAVDITQESFFQAWQHFAKIRTFERPQAWLYRVASHLVFNLRRERAMSFSHFALFQQADDDSLAEGQFIDPLDLEAQTIARDMIAQALAKLPERDRATLLLRAVHDLNFKEIGAALDLSEVAVRKVLSRARERFRAALLLLEENN